MLLCTSNYLHPTTKSLILSIENMSSCNKKKQCPPRWTLSTTVTSLYWVVPLIPRHSEYLSTPLRCHRDPTTKIPSFQHPTVTVSIQHPFQQSHPFLRNMYSCNKNTVSPTPSSVLTLGAVLLIPLRVPSHPKCTCVPLTNFIYHSDILTLGGPAYTPSEYLPGPRWES